MERPLRLRSPAGLLSAWSMLRGVMLRRTKVRGIEGMGANRSGRMGKGRG